MTKIITDDSVISFASFCSASTIAPEQVWNLQVLTPKASLPDGDVYTHGVRLHALLCRVKDHGPLSAQERRYLPFLEALRSELRRKGVNFLDPEKTLSHPLLGTGRCDLLLDGGLAPLGICELKCVANNPPEVRLGDLHQLGRYGAMLSATERNCNLWGCVAYVCISSRTIRIFAYPNLSKISRGILKERAA